MLMDLASKQGASSLYRRSQLNIIWFHSSVHLVELQGTGELYAMKAMDKSVMLTRNKVIFYI